MDRPSGKIQGTGVPKGNWFDPPSCRSITKIWKSHSTCTGGRGEGGWDEENGKIPDGIGHHRHALRFSFPFPDGMDFLNPPAPRRDMQLPVNHSCWGGSNPEKTLNASAYPPSSVSDCKRPSVLDSLRLNSTLTGAYLNTFKRLTQ
jgi:hypothetical protein